MGISGILVYARLQADGHTNMQVLLARFFFLHLYFIPTLENYIGHSGSWFNPMPSHKPKTPMKIGQIRSVLIRHQQQRKQSASPWLPEHSPVQLHGRNISASLKELLQGEVQSSLTVLFVLSSALSNRKRKHNKHYAPWQCNSLT